MNEIERTFPRLPEEGYALTSPFDNRYNCIAWSLGDDRRFWWPDRMGIHYWPRALRRIETLEGFIRMYKLHGYSPCEDDKQEAGYEKIVLYVNDFGKPTHAARQLPSGKWTSKLGQAVDIEHTLEGLVSDLYGRPHVFFRRTAKA